jgi:hypothetical protein
VETSKRRVSHGQRSLLGFAITQWTTWAVLVVIGVGVALTALSYARWDHMNSNPSGWQAGWSANADVLVSAGTFIVALVLGAGAIYRQWRESLPLRLCVRFDFVSGHGGAVPQLLVIDAPLAGFSDARAWSQQIARAAPILGPAGSDELRLGAFDVSAPRLVSGPAADGHEPAATDFPFQRVFVRYSLTAEITPDASDGRWATEPPTTPPVEVSFDAARLTTTYRDIDTPTLLATWKELGGDDAFSYS